MYGFGSSAHLIIQVAVHRGWEVYALTREGDAEKQEEARELGAAWAGAVGDPEARDLDAAIIFAPAGELVPAALAALAPGGTVVCAGHPHERHPLVSLRDPLARALRPLRCEPDARDGEEFIALAPAGSGARPRSRYIRSPRPTVRWMTCVTVGFGEPPFWRSAASLTRERVARARRTLAKGRGRDQMPDVTVKRVEDFEAIFGGGFRRARAGLGVSSFGLAVIDLPPNFQRFPEHDQTHDDQEEVYTLLSGRVTLRVGGEEYELEPGCLRPGRGDREAKARSPAMSRRASSPWARCPGRVYEPPEFTEEGTKPPSMDKIASKNASSSPSSGTGRPRRAEAWRCAAWPVARRSPGRPRPETIAPGTPESLSRTRSAAEASSSASAITRRRELAAMLIAPAAPVGERREAGAADRDVRLTDPPGAAEAVGDHDRGGGARSLGDLAADAPRGGVAVLGQQRDRGPPRGWRSRCRRSAQTQPPRVSVISTPRSARTTRLLSARISSTSAGSLSSSRGQLRARSPGSTSARRRTRPSTFETAFCETTRSRPRAPGSRPRRSGARGHLPRAARAGR